MMPGLITGLIEGQFVYTLTAGMVVTLNPCGFAMLPAYLSSFVGLSGPVDERRPAAGNVTRALVVSAAVSLGFMAVFLVLGSIIKAGADQVFEASKWFTLVVGVALAILGVAVMAGYKLPIFVPKLDKGGQGRSFRSMFVYGVSYAIASLGCSLPVFLGVLFGSAKTDGVASGLISFVLYGLGFALVLGGLTVSLALAQGGLLKFLRSSMKWIDRLSGVFLLLAGLYLTWYGINAIRERGDGLLRQGENWSGRLQSWIQNTGAVKVAGVCAVLVVIAALAVLRGRCSPAANHVTFAELLSSAGVVETVELRSTFGVMAYHGGHLERMTDVIAYEVAERTGSSYYGVHHPPELGEAEHHLPSTSFDPAVSPALRSFVDHVELVITVHGYGRHGFWTHLLLGGTNRDLARHVELHLAEWLPAYTLISDLDEIPTPLRGLHPNNPVNLPARGGVQLELPPRVRGQSPLFWDWEGPGPCPHSQAVIEGLVSAITAL